MSQIECPFESDVLTAVLQSRWPERVDAELREHAKSCRICSDVAVVADAIEFAREDSVAAFTAHDGIPDSGRVWWKAQMRARREALETVARPITAVQVVAFACGVGLVGACIGATSHWFQAGLKWAWNEVAGVNPGALIPYAAALIAGHGLLAACMVAMVFVVPVAVYLAIGRD